ncbi:MAG: MFS transporter [Bacteroidia bacterium]
MEKNNPTILRAWTMYDWANSVYSLSITSAMFPVFYGLYTEENITFFGTEFKNTALFAYFLSFAFLVNASLAPILSGIADARGNKKAFMRFFIVLGSVSCSSLFFFDGSNPLFGLTAFMLATLGFAGSIVFYNAYLPEIATPDRFDKLSARGFTMGYIGSVILLILNILFLQKSTWFGMTEPTATNTLPFRIGFLTVGIWWFGWSLWPLIKLPGRIESKEGSSIWNGYREIKNTFLQVRGMKPLLVFLASFFVYTMGVQTVLYVATLFGQNELKLESSDMIKTILLIQVIGIAGAYFFAWLANKKGNKTAIIIALFIWIIGCYLTFYIEEKKPMQFFGLACIVGTVMGGIQSLSRATYAKLIPGYHDNASFFSFYEVTEKIAIVLGTFAWGVVDQITGSMRNGVVVLMVFFILGIIILFFLKSDKLKPQKTA